MSQTRFLRVSVARHGHVPTGADKGAISNWAGVAIPSPPLLDHVGFFGFGNIKVFRQAATFINSDDSPCGTIMLDGFEETKFYKADKTFELLFISRTMSVLPEGEVGYSMGGLSGIDCYRVMLVEEMESFVGRRGIGGVKKSAIRRCLAPGPVWKEIVLA